MHAALTNEQMRTTPRVILIMKRSSLRTRRHKTLAQKMTKLWWQEFTKKSHAVPPVHLQARRREEALPGSHNLAVKMLFRPLRQLILQQLANNNSANLHWNINKFSKVPKWLTTTMPSLDGKSKMFRLCEDFLQTTLKTHNQLIEDDRNKYFQSLMREHALETFKNVKGPTPENLREILAVFRKKYVKPQPMVTAKQNSRTCFQSSEWKLSRFFLFSKPGQRCIRFCRTCHHRTIYICQNATTPK